MASSRGVGRADLLKLFQQVIRQRSPRLFGKVVGGLSLAVLGSRVRAGLE